MAYATGGSGGSLTDLMDALRLFAAGLGWTIDKWDAVNRLLFMTKGICTVTMKGFTTDLVPVFTGVNGSGVFANQPDHRLRFAMGTGNTAALGTYHSHPGSPVTTDLDADAPWVGGLQGPYVAWFFFADPTVSDHIHVVVQITAECYAHFSLGFVDKKGMTHSGVAYVTAAPGVYYRNVSNWLTGGGNAYNAPSAQTIPFCSGGASQPASWEGNAPIILKHVDAWPAGWLGPVAYGSGAAPLFGLMHRQLNHQLIDRPGLFTAANAQQGCLLDCVVVSEPAPYSNIVPLFPIPVFRQHVTSLDANGDRLCYVGDFPNVRLLNMTNLLPGQEIAVDTDTYKIFPAVRQAAWADTNLVPQPSSGQFAIAYKKVP